MSNRTTNSPETKSPPFIILKRTTWLQQILIDPEVKDFDNDGLYLICSICPQSNGCLKKFRPEQALHLILPDGNHTVKPFNIKKQEN